MRNKLICLKMKAWNGMETVKGFLRKKVEGVSGFVVTLILIAVACALGVLFKDQLIPIFTGWFSKMGAAGDKLF